MEKVEDIKRPLIKGERLLVPCLVRTEFIPKDENEMWLDIKTHSGMDKQLFIMPVINHPHSDKENGQDEIHYHLDYRFIKHSGTDNIFIPPTIKRTHTLHTYGNEFRPLKESGEFMYIELPVINTNFVGVTPPNLIKKSKLKHKCAHKGKCPHRGYDLSQVPLIDGIKTCPLHGLQFDKHNKLVKK